MAGMTADEVYVLLGDEITLLTEEVKQMEGWEPIEHKGTVQTAEDLPADAKKGWMYNIATDSVYGAAGMNVVMTSKGWDPMGPIINMNLYLTKEEGTKSFQPKGNYLSGTDTDLKESGKAADAKATGEKIAKNSSDIAKKLGKNQGSENSGKVAGINEVGDIVPMFPMGVEYNSETNCLEFGSDQKMKLNQGIGLDNTLTKSGSAADAGVTGKKIDSLKEDLSNKITKFYASNQGETHLADSDNGKIMDMMLYGRSEQKQYSGKNLLNPTLQTTTQNGVTCTNNGDGTYTVNGTATGIAVFVVYYNFADVYGSASSLKMVGCPSGGSAQKYFLRSYRKGGNPEILDEYGSGISIGSFKESESNIAIIVKSGATVNNLIFKPMLTTDITATYADFEPYTGGIPSPNPDYPQEIKSVVNPTVKVSNEDGTQFKTVSLPYTLNAIPVSSGGNITIDDQQYIADYVDVERGKLVRNVLVKTFTGNEGWAYSDATDDSEKRFYLEINKKIKSAIGISNYLRSIGADITKGDNCFVTYTKSLDVRITSIASLAEFKSFLARLDSNGKPLNVLFALGTPEEIDLTQEEISAFKALSTNYPVTNIEVSSDQLDGYTVFNYPISMENGWNYVKQQIGDTRDYIYDMDARTQDTDLQAAEAYVNSEYAVALTELEV